MAGWERGLKKTLQQKQHCPEARAVLNQDDKSGVGEGWKEQSKEGNGKQFQIGGG